MNGKTQDLGPAGRRPDATGGKPAERRPEREPGAADRDEAQHRREQREEMEHQQLPDDPAERVGDFA